jgi:hypothetical protein
MDVNYKRLNVEVDQLVTTGTPSGDTFLAGDGSYQEITTEPFDVVGGRLDLVSATSLKWGFQNSAQIRLFNPTSEQWELVTCSSEPTLANTANDLNGSALVPNTIYDIFAEYSSPTAFNLVASRWSYGGDGANNSSTSYATPVMTANNAPGPVVVSSDSGSRAAYLAFTQTNADTIDNWISANTSFPHGLMIDFRQAVCINKYAIQAQNYSGSGKCVPSTWTLEASNSTSSALTDATGTNGWVVLDTQTSRPDPGQSGWVTATDTTTYFKFKNSKSYLIYRLLVTAVSDGIGSYCVVANLKLVSDNRSLAGGSSRVSAYESTVTYYIGDRVTYGGHDWVCIQSGTGQTPAAGSYWVDNGTSVSGDFAGLYRHDGVLVSDSSTTGKKRRWLGIIYTYNYNNSGTVNFKDDVNYRYVSNYYNRRQSSCHCSNSTSNWTYTTAAWREFNAGTGHTRGHFILAESSGLVFLFNVLMQNAQSSNQSHYTGIGYNDVSPNLAQQLSVLSANTYLVVAFLGKVDTALRGFNYFTAIEHGNSSTVAIQAQSYFGLYCTLNK